MKKLLQAVWGLFLETVFPAVCCGCRREGGFLCKGCERAVDLRGDFEVENVDFEALDGVVACAEYVDGRMMARLIHALKYDFVVDLAEPLGEFLVQAFERAELEMDVICAVPLHKKRLRWRGFNQAELLARVLSEEVGVPISDGLRRIHFKKAQKELRKEERRTNIVGAFEVSDESLRGKTVLLVDDVATTMATLEACASVLKEAGVQRVYGIVLARVY